jgi:hypothetical protein
MNIALIVRSGSVTTLPPFRRRLFGRSGGRLPVLAPPGPLIIGQVFVPARRVLGFLWVTDNWNASAQVADERHL